MKRLLKGFYMSLGMFCAIPLPVHLWDDTCMNLMLPCFPLIGLLLGAIWWGAAELLAFCSVNVVLAAAILAIMPFLLAGFLHLDGYMDTSDAMLSRRPIEEKLQILKDPHKGAFSIVMIAVLFLLQFAAVYAIFDSGKHYMTFLFISVISRCCAAISLLHLGTIQHSGFASAFRQNTSGSHKAFVYLLAAAAIAGSYLLIGLSGLISVLAAILGFSGAMAYSFREFKGVSGDLAGFSLVLGELCGLIVLGVLA